MLSDIKNVQMFVSRIDFIVIVICYMHNEIPESVLTVACLEKVKNESTMYHKGKLKRKKHHRKEKY